MLIAEISSPCLSSGELMTSGAGDADFSCMERPKEAAVAGKLDWRSAKIDSNMIKLQTTSVRRLRTTSGSF